jgi:pimeloyl-ACP methyl ester carboxylesterase
MPKEKFSPHGALVREGLTLYQNGKTIEFSILPIPSGEGVSEEVIQEHCMVPNFEVAQYRADHKEEIEKIHEEIKEPIVLKDETGEISLSIKLANQNEESELQKPTMCLFTPWSTHGKMDNIQLDIEALALQFRDYQIMFIDTPGMGESSDVSDKAILDMQQTGSYITMAEQIAEVLKNNPEYSSNIEMTIGLSEGGDIAVALAYVLKEKGICDVQEVYSFDAPGITKKKLAKFALDFMFKEGLNHLGKIKKNSPDILMQKAHTDDQKNHPLKIHKGKLIPRGKAMAAGGHGGDIVLAAQKGLKITEFSAGNSTITDTEVAISLAKDLPGFSVVESPKAGHGFYEINPFLIPLFIKAIQQTK